MDGPIPAKSVQQTISRATRTWTRGKGSFMVPTTTLATSPNLALPESTPPPIHTVGVDAQSASYRIPAIPFGETYMLPYTIGLSNLTSWARSTSTRVVSSQTAQVSAARSDMTTLSKDGILFLAHLDAIEKDDTILFVTSHTVQGRGNAQGFQHVGPVLPSGKSYQAFGAFGHVVFYATSAYMGGSVTLHVSGTLHAQPG